MRSIQSLLGRVLSVPNLPRDVYEKIMEELDARDEPEAPSAAAEPKTCAKCNELARLLVECRDALPAISLASARLHHVSLSLADRIAAALKPWEVKEGEEGGI